MGGGPWARAGDAGGWPDGVCGVSLTCTYSYCVPRAVPTVVAVEAPVGVTDSSLRAVVPELLSTHLTAFAAVCDEADPQRAAGRGWRALARPLAELGVCRGALQGSRGEDRGRGSWREGLQGKGRRKGSCQVRGSEAKGLQSPSHLHGVQKAYAKLCFSTMLLLARRLLSPRCNHRRSRSSET